MNRPFPLHFQDVDGAWAGGRGFKKQPYLTVADAGGSTITMDSTTMVTASVTPSLMVRACMPYGMSREQGRVVNAAPGGAPEGKGWVA